MGHWHYEYDPVGTLHLQTDAMGQQITFGYDDVGRVTMKSGGNPPVTESYTYDQGTNGLGRRTSMSDASGGTTYSYDARGRVTSETRTIAGTAYTTTYAYDEMDRVVSVTHHNGEVVKYVYGDHGQLIGIESSTQGLIVKSAGYNALGKVNSILLGNNQTTSYQYWGVEYTAQGNANYGRLRSIATGGAQGLTYNSYDAVGNVTQLTDTRNNYPSGETIDFAYDQLDRLTHCSLFTQPTYYYNQIGTFQSKEGVSYVYNNPANQARRAPSVVGGNQYTYDANGNLETAEDRTYGYDARNRLTSVVGGGLPSRAFVYDGDGVCRRTLESGSPRMHYVTPDYQVNVATGEGYIYYRFGGRAIAWHGNIGVRYLLGDHLSSTHGEMDAGGGDVAQRRYYPFGGDWAVSGAADLSRDERYTGQRRIDNGGGNGRRELYYYGARWYLPGVGIFTQPDSVEPDYNNPQALNRYGYCVNNPVKFSDSTGHTPDQWDPKWDANWAQAFESQHQGKAPTEQDWQDRQLSLRYLVGTGPSGTWTDQDWAAYGQVRAALGGDLLYQVGKSGLSGADLYTFGGALLQGALGHGDVRLQEGPDGTVIANSVLLPPGATAITLGNLIVLGPDVARDRPTLMHEYVHVLQYRKYGIDFKAQYEKAGGYYNWQKNALERVGMEIERAYGMNPWLPPLWAFPYVR